MYVLDSDILSIHQSERGNEYQQVLARLSRVDPTKVFVSIISFHEQAIGWHTYLQRAKDTDGLIRGYGKFERMLLDFSRLNILGFDRIAAEEYHQLKSLGIHTGAMDLRIAAVALANDCTVVTRNTIDFERVPGLKIEDWTLPIRS